MGGVIIKRFICILTVIIITISIMALPTSATSDYDTYILTDEEMYALLSTCTATIKVYDSNGNVVYSQTLNFSKSSSSSPPLYLIQASYSGGPNSSAVVDLNFNLDISCASIKIQEYASTVYYTYSNNSAVYESSQAPTFNHFYLNSTISPTSHSSFGGQLQYDGRLINGQTNINEFNFSQLTKIDTIKSDYTVNWRQVYSNVFVYGIQSISFTATAPVIDNLQEAISAIINNNNVNTQKIIDSHNAKAAEIIANQNDNTDKIISSLDTPSEDTQNQVDDFNQQIDSVDTKLDDLADGMHVDVPDLETELDLSIIDDNFDSNYVTSVFSVIFGHSFLVTLVLISFTFAVFGVIIRGKNDS